MNELQKADIPTEPQLVYTLYNTFSNYYEASDYVVLGLASGLRHFLWNSCIVDYCMVFPYEYPSKLFVS